MSYELKLLIGVIVIVGPSLIGVSFRTTFGMWMAMYNLIVIPLGLASLGFANLERAPYVILGAFVLGLCSVAIGYQAWGLSTGHFHDPDGPTVAVTALEAVAQLVGTLVALGVWALRR